MTRNNSRYLQIAAYVMLAAIFVIFLGISRDCGRIRVQAPEGNSGGDTLDVAIIYGPGSLYFSQDSLSGINHEIVESFSKETGLPVKIWPIIDASTGMSKLENGSFDLLASLPLDNNIKKKFLVSESIFLDRLVLIQLSDSTTGEKLINSSLDLNGKTVYISAGSAALQRLSNLSNEIGGQIEIIEEPDLSDELLSLKVANGSIPFAVVNEKVAKSLTETYPNLNYDSSVSFTQFQVYLFNPQDSLTFSKFNEWFNEFKTTEEYRDILSR